MVGRRKRASKRKRKTLADKGRKIRASARTDLRGEAVDRNGNRPRKGWWLVHEGRRRCYGRILRLRRDGIVVTVCCGWRFHHAGSMLFEGGYTYVTDRPSGDGWKFHALGTWVDEPPPGWDVVRKSTKEDEPDD